MKQHLGFPKAKAQTNVHSVGDFYTEETDIANSADQASPSNTRMFEKQLAELQTQMASLKAALNDGTPKNSRLKNHHSYAFYK